LRLRLTRDQRTPAAAAPPSQADRYFPAATVRLSTETTTDSSPETGFRPMSSDADHRVPNLRFRLLVTFAAFAAWAVGIVVRVTTSGFGCPHWTPCTARAVPLDQRAPVIEYSQRAVVTIVGVLVVAVAGGAELVTLARPQGPAPCARGRALAGAVPAGAN